MSADWDGREMVDETYHRVLFQDVDMTEVADRGSTFEECTFASVRFNVSTHESVRFLNCTFRRCSFFDATFTDCKLTGSMFDACDYGLLKVKGGDWSYVGLPGADLRGSVFEEVRLREADLTGARLAG
ncbi:pentapeptide repeat-containing protein, partial [Streptosporangium algeriense]